MEELTIPDKLYGRERDIDALLKSFERISSGHGQVLLIPGPSGVGKTALVHELERPILQRNGVFIRGKFDQYQQNIPYFAFRQALTELCRKLQLEDASRRSRHKADILHSVGNLGQVLIELVPAFEAFLGTQPPLEDISPQEARHRFADVFRNFLKVICRPEHPLVLFLDDWQWADAASCELLRQIQVGITLHYLLVIVSYRDNEVSASHPLMSAVDDLRSRAVPVEVLEVRNITANDVQKIVADTLWPAADNVETLAALIHGRTLGNPFFVRSFLGFLHQFNLIWFEKARNCWQWDIEKEIGSSLPDSIVELFVLKLNRLDVDSRNLFSLAACLGSRFDLETLSVVSGLDHRECMALLSSGQAKTLLLPFAGDGINNGAETLRIPKVFEFLHDRVQQAAYSLIEPEERPHILQTIGRVLLGSLHPEQLAERLFEVVSDLNAGRHLIQDTAEQIELVELNIAAGRKAYAGTAYGSALQFYRAANGFLQTPGFAGHLWHERHDLIMHLFEEGAECEFLEGHYAEAEDLIQQAVAHAATVIEKAAALNILIVQYTLLARYPEAIAAGRQALAALEIILPEERYEEARDEEIARVRHELGSRPVSSLTELPVMSNPEMLMASKILITLGPPCYRSHQRLWSVIVPKVVNLTLHYGNIPQVGYSHTAFGGLLGWVDNDYATAREFGELATRLMTATFRSPSYHSVFYLMIGSSIRHWFRHLRYATQDYADAYQIGLRSGNLQYAAYAFGHDMYCQFYQGVPLAGLAQATRRSLEFSRTHLNQWAIDLLEGGLRIIGTLSAEGSGSNGTEGGPEKEFLQRVEEHHNIQVTCIYKVLGTFAQLMLGDHERALLLSDETEPLIYTVGTQGLLPWPEHVFARLLILTALYARADEARQAQWRNELDLLIGRIRIWTDHCPDNFEHKYFLAAAELARIDHRPVEAMQLYDKAVDAAQAAHFLQWEGMANERAHSFWMECGNLRIAQVYWQQAYSCYDRWGAVAKVHAMESVYRQDLAGDLPGTGSGDPAGSLQRQMTAVVMERQIGQLRNYASQMQQTGLRIEAATQAGELTDAMQRVRVEIAERKRTEEALRESEQSLKDSQIIASMGSYVLDIPAGLWKSSDALDQLFGIDQAYPRSVEGWAALIHPDDRGMIVNYLRNEVIGQGRAFDREYRIVHHVNKAERWVHGLGKLEFDAQGHPLKMHGTIQDISERWRMEERLRKLSRAVDQSPVSIVITNAAGDIDYINPKFVEVSGFTAEEVLGRNSRTLSSGDTSPEVGRELTKTITSGREWHGELHNRRKNGELYWESTSISPIRNAAGVISHYVAVSEDITARKRGEAERDQLIEDLQSALGNVKSLSGLLPICAGCKKIRDDQGYWSQVESYIQTHSEATFSHGMCPDCIRKWWPELEAKRDGPGSNS